MKGRFVSTGVLIEILDGKKVRVEELRFRALTSIIWEPNNCTNCNFVDILPFREESFARSRESQFIVNARSKTWTARAKLADSNRVLDLSFNC